MPAPNWKHPSDYPKKADDLTPQAWAWEFLRRNPDYRSDYNKVQTALAKVKAKGPPAPGSWLARPDDPAADPETRIYDPPLEPNESLHAWRMRSLLDGRDPKDYPLKLWYARKWKLRELVDPDESYTADVCFEVPSYPTLVQWEDLAAYFGPSDNNFTPVAPYAVIVFDVGESIKAQVASAHKVLMEARRQFKQRGLLDPKKGKSWTQNWPIYLQVLDAVRAGATPKQIVDALFPYKNKASGPSQEGTKRAFELIAQAQKVRDGGYIQILRS